MHSLGDHLGANMNAAADNECFIDRYSLGAFDVMLYTCLMIVNGINQVYQARSLPHPSPYCQFELYRTSLSRLSKFSNRQFGINCNMSTLSKWPIILGATYIGNF